MRVDNNASSEAAWFFVVMNDARVFLVSFEPFGSVTEQRNDFVYENVVLESDFSFFLGGGRCGTGRI